MFAIGDRARKVHEVYRKRKIYRDRKRYGDTETEDIPDFFALLSSVSL